MSHKTLQIGISAICEQLGGKFDTPIPSGKGKGRPMAKSFPFCSSINICAQYYKQDNSLAFGNVSQAKLSNMGRFIGN